MISVLLFFFLWSDNRHLIYLCEPFRCQRYMRSLPLRISNKMSRKKPTMFWGRCGNWLKFFNILQPLKFCVYVTFYDFYSDLITFDSSWWNATTFPTFGEVLTKFWEKMSNKFLFRTFLLFLPDGSEFPQIASCFVRDLDETFLTDPHFVNFKMMMKL